MQTSLTFTRNPILPEVLDQLVRHYGRAEPAKRDALRQLIYMVVAKGAAPSVGLAIFARLQAVYPTWARLRDAESRHLETLFVGLPHRQAKAKVLPRLLAVIEERVGDLDLDFLDRMSADGAQRWLEALPGVDHTLASAVLAFSTLKKSSLSVDRENVRPIRRLGLCSPGAPLSAVAREVVEATPPDWGADELAALGVGLQKLAARVCHRGRPDCGACPLSKLCPSSGQTAEVVAFPGSREIQPAAKTDAA